MLSRRDGNRDRNISRGIRRTGLAALLLCALWSGGARLVAGEDRGVTAALESITGRELYGHAGLLAGDAFEGREAGSRGGRAAGIYIVEQLRKVKAVKPAGVEGSYYQPFGAGYRNILVLLPGRDAALKHECVLVCAHYDHVGYGTPRNSFGPIGFIHNGADDNASGVAGLLEIIGAFAQLDRPPKRSLLFVFWDAEEKGLLGAEHWIRRPTIPLKRIRMVINLDMIGRLREGRVEIHGSRSARGLRRWISENNREKNLKLDFRWSLPRESDHNAFLQAGMPAIMLHTRKHADYHRPTDDANKLNVAGMRQMTRLAWRLAYSAANADRLAGFRPDCLREDDDDRERLTAEPEPLPVRLGVSWNAALAKTGVIEVVEVSSGSPAQRAGLRPGDRIVRLAGTDVRSGAQFRYLVMSAPSAVRMTVQRGKQNRPVSLMVRLDGRPHRLGIAWEIDAAEPGTVVLRRVIRNSPADAAGLRVGDRIYTVDGKPFRTNDEFRSRIAAARDKLALSVERAGSVHTVNVNFPGMARPSGGPPAPLPASRP